MRTAREVEAEIMREYAAYLTYDLAGDPDEAQIHYDAMNAALEEYLRIPHPRLPSDQPVRLRS